MAKKAGIKISSTLDEAVYEVTHVPSAALLDALEQAGVRVATLLQVGSQIVFSASLEDRVVTAAVLDRLHATWSEREHLAEVTVVSPERERAAIVTRALRILRDIAVDPPFVVTSPGRLALFVPETDRERTLEALTERLQLTAKTGK